MKPRSPSTRSAPATACRSRRPSSRPSRSSPGFDGLAASGVDIDPGRVVRAPGEGAADGRHRPAVLGARRAGTHARRRRPVGPRAEREGARARAAPAAWSASAWASRRARRTAGRTPAWARPRPPTASSPWRSAPVPRARPCRCRCSRRSAAASRARSPRRACSDSSGAYLDAGLAPRQPRRHGRPREPGAGARSCSRRSWRARRRTSSARATSTTPTAWGSRTATRRCEVGVRTFETAFAGMGGCPFTAVAAGNVATEDFVHALPDDGPPARHRPRPRWSAVANDAERVLRARRCRARCTGPAPCRRHGGRPDDRSMSSSRGIRVLDMTNVLAGPFATLLPRPAAAPRSSRSRTREDGDLARKLGNVPALNDQLMGTSFLAQNANKKSRDAQPEAGRGQGASSARLVEDGRRRSSRTSGRASWTASASATSVAPRVEPAADLLRHLRLRPDRPRRLQAGLRPDHPGPERRDGDQRRRAAQPAALRLPGVRHGGRAERRVRHRGRALPPRAHGRGTVHRRRACSTRSCRSWAGLRRTCSSAGKPPVPMGNDNFTAAPSGTFATADGYINIAANQQEQWEAVCDVRRPARAEDRPALPEARRAQEEPQGAHAAARGEAHRAADRALGRGAQRRAACPSGDILSLEAALASAADRAPRVDRGRGRAGRSARSQALQPHREVRDDTGPARPRRRPRLSADTEAVLGELGYSPEDVARLRQQGIV